MEELVRSYENIFMVYCSNKKARYYIKFPSYVYQDCIDKFLILKNDKIKIKVFEKAIKYADEEVKKIKLPSSWEKSEELEEEENE